MRHVHLLDMLKTFQVYLVVELHPGVSYTLRVILNNFIGQNVVVLQQ